MEIAETFAPLVREKGLSIRIGPGDGIVETDAGLLRSIIQNYLSNAIRYTQKGGIIIGVRRRGGMARIDVIDSGPGIPVDKQKQIFREFERLENANEGGIGLGLAIVERTARVLGARISLRSRQGRGSRFSIALPSSHVEPELTQHAAIREREHVGRLGILVVDDDPANCDAMESYLLALGHRTLSATSAQGALELQSDFEVALIDFNLGDEEDGLWLIARLREQYPDARYALVTAARTEEYSMRPELANVSVLRKPVSASDLEQWLHAKTRI